MKIGISFDFFTRDAFELQSKFLDLILNLLEVASLIVLVVLLLLGKYDLDVLVPLLNAQNYLLLEQRVRVLHEFHLDVE